LSAIALAAAAPLWPHARRTEVIVPTLSANMALGDLYMTLLLEFFLLSSGRYAMAPVVVANLLLIEFGLVEAWRARRAACIQIAFVSLLPAILVVMLYTILDRPFPLRYALTALPGMLILWALGMRGLARMVTIGLRKNIGRLGWAAAFALGAAYGATGFYVYQNERPHRFDWRALARQLERIAKPGDLVVVDNLYFYEALLEFQLDRVGVRGLDVRMESDVTDAQRDSPYWRIVQKDFFGKKHWRVERRPGMGVEGPRGADANGVN
jgi:hypothetical protein